MSMLYTLMVGDGTRVTRPLKLLGADPPPPREIREGALAAGWSRRTIILLVMQTLDNAIALRPKLKRSGEVRLQTEQDPERPNPTFIPVANEAAAWLAKRTGGIAQSSTTEAFDEHPDDGAHPRRRRDRPQPRGRRRRRPPARLRLREPAGLRRRRVPANVGVNPSLTITALAEHAMSHIPPAAGEGLPGR